MDEALDYIDEIKRQSLIERINGLFIAHNPHSKKPKQLIDTWINELKKLESRSMINLVDDLPEEGAFDKLRSLFGQKPKKKK